jgi:cell division protein FtsB
MKMFGRKQTRNSRPSLRGRCGTLAFSLVFLVLSPQWIHAQAADQDNVAQQIQQLTDAMAKVQAQEAGPAPHGDGAEA